MKIEETSVDEIRKFLAEQFRDGHKWVAYSDYKPELTKADLKCFKDFESAKNHCSNEFEYFKPISNVLKKLEPERYEQVKDVDTEQLKNELAKLPIEVFRLDDDLTSQLAKGEMYPVLITRKIEPEAEISKYNIYEHTHPGHQVYEIGHEISLVSYFENQKEAIEYWNDLMDTSSKLTGRRRPDFIMVAQFKDQKPILDVEGIPDQNSAVLLKTAYPKFNEEGYNVKTWQDLNSLQIKQPVLAKFNTQNNQLEFFNSRLAKIDPHDKIPYMDLNFFSTKEVVQSNSHKQAIHQDNLQNPLTESEKQHHKINRGL